MDSLLCGMLMQVMKDIELVLALNLQKWSKKLDYLQPQLIYIIYVLVGKRKIENLSVKEIYKHLIKTTVNPKSEIEKEHKIGYRFGQI